MFDTNMIARKIRQARIDKNMTQMNLADATGVSYQAVSNWERGTSMPDITKLGDLCQTLGLSVNELLGVEEPAAQAAAKAMEQEELTLEELAEVAPMLKPSEVRKKTERTTKGKKASLSNLMALAPFLDEDYLDELIRGAEWEDLDELAGLAPFLKRQTLDYLVEQMESEDLEDMVGLAPFLSRETLEKAVRRCAANGDFDVLVSLAPFLGKEALDRLAEHIQPDDLGEIASIAPFLGKQTLEKLVMWCMDLEELDALEELAPFLSRDTLEKLVERYIEADCQEDLSGIYPFMGKDALRKLAKHLMGKRDLDALEDLMPFV